MKMLGIGDTVLVLYEFQENEGCVGKVGRIVSISDSVDEDWEESGDYLVEFKGRYHNALHEGDGYSDYPNNGMCWWYPETYLKRIKLDNNSKIIIKGGANV